LFVYLWSCAALCSAAPQAVFVRKKEEEEGDGNVLAIAFFFLLLCCVALPSFVFIVALRCNIAQ
jgi:hypothetical protein